MTDEPGIVTQPPIDSATITVIDEPDKSLLTLAFRAEDRSMSELPYRLGIRLKPGDSLKACARKLMDFGRSISDFADGLRGDADGNIVHSMRVDE